MDVQHLTSRFSTQNALDFKFRIDFTFLQPLTLNIHPKVEEAARGR